MKKVVVLLCMAALAGNAQPYGEKIYPHNLTVCSSGELASVNTGINGFVTSGIVPVPPVGGFPNYYIDKTGPGGLFAPAAAVPFSKAYFLFGDQACSPNMPQAKLMYGTDVIEATASGIGGWYAHTAVSESGCFFSMLDPNGNPLLVPGGFYPFPAGANNPTRPVIVASSNPNEYIICGAYEMGGVYTMYVLRVSETGGPAVGLTYTFPGPSSSLIPADMILSPYTPFGVNEVVIVGKVTDAYSSPGSGDRGFLAHLDVNTLLPSTGGVIQIYGQPAGAGGVDSFSSIVEAASFNAGGNGFAIGGSTDAYGPGSGMVWALKVDPTGNTIYWNNVIQPLSDPNATDMIAIRERFSFTTLSYEYFGAVISTKGMMVLKLDDNGLPFSTGFNEFLYYGALANPSISRDLTFINNGAATDVGIQVYGTDDAVTGGFHHFVEGAFNGFSANGCSSSYFTGATAMPGPSNIDYHDMSIMSGLNFCPNFNIRARVLQTQPKILCDSPTLPADGDNSRLMAGTGINAQQNADKAFKVSPNPVNSRVEVTFTASENAVVDVKVYDYLGRFVQSMSVMNQDGNTRVANLDMSTLNIESGIYIIRTTVDGVSSQQKIIYTKGQ